MASLPRTHPIGPCNDIIHKVNKMGNLAVERSMCGEHARSDGRGACHSAPEVASLQANGLQAQGMHIISKDTVYTRKCGQTAERASIVRGGGACRRRSARTQLRGSPRTRNVSAEYGDVEGTAAYGEVESAGAY